MSEIILSWNNRLIDYTSVVSFSPLNYSPIAWYDSSDVATITKDISDKVSQWNDKSGLGYHLGQSVDLNKPTYSGGTGVVFDGVNDYMSKSFGITYLQPFTTFVVWYPTITGLDNVIAFDGVDGTNRVQVAVVNNDGPSRNHIFAGAILPFPTTTYPFISPVVNTGLFNGSNSKIYENNNVKNAGNAGTNSLAGLIVGSRYSLDQAWMKGPIKEIIIYNSALTPTQITTVNNYLNSKYNIY